jgi:dimethylargininase
MRAIVRSMSDSYVRATVAEPSAEPIDVQRAGVQHSAYVAVLRDLGVDVQALPADEAFPDGCFVEDQAVVARGVALITRSGNLSRRAEAASIARALEGAVELVRMVDGTLDGGDVLAVGDTLFVGRSGRTDPSGIRALRDTFEPLGMRVVGVSMGPWLHLKCACSAPGPGLVLLAPGLDPRPFEAVADVAVVPEAESYAANTVAIGGHALVAAGFPATAELLATRGITPIALDTTEIRKGDGALTCLSIFY